MKRNVSDAGGATGEVRDFIGSVRSYLYRRVDTTGRSFALDWKTNADTKERMMNAMNDALSRQLLVLKSAEMVEEMRTVIRENGSISHASHTHDDRVIAAALASVAWADFMRTEAAKARQFYEEQKVRENPVAAFERSDDVGAIVVQGYLRRAGIA